MNVPAAGAVVVERPIRCRELDQSKVFGYQTLKSVVLWSPRARRGSLQKWRTGFEFSNSVSVVPNAMQAPPRLPTIVTSTVQPGTYAGISVEMFQPFSHEYHVQFPGGPGNLYGTLSAVPCLKNVVFSRTANLFRIRFQVAVTVKDVLDLIIYSKKQYYRFHPDGRGSLHWQLALLEAFVAKKWIEYASFDEAMVWILTLETSTTNGVKLPIVKGEFYDPVIGL